MERYSSDKIVAGCDEAGRGCLAGPVVAAAVILPVDFEIRDLRDSKKLNLAQRESLRERILAKAIDYSVALKTPREIEKLNILWASVAAMHSALDDLQVKPDRILVDGNRFREYHGIDHECVIKGDDKYACIAAASILAKTFRDDYMRDLAQRFPVYRWDKNKGYPTREHRKAIIENGACEHHRRTFRLVQPTLF